MTSNGLFQPKAFYDTVKHSTILGTTVKLGLGWLRCPAPDECLDSRPM